MIMMRDPKTFCFNLIGQKMLMRIRIMKLNNKIKQLLIKYKHGNNIHDHRKQQNE